MRRVLLVEDDTDILRTNAKMLSYEGYEVICAETAAAGFEAVISCNPAVIVLDILLPDGDGLSLCEKIRGVSAAPILFLSGLSGSADRVRGLMRGGDDYLVKPYDMDELLARIHALLRRSQAGDAAALQFPPLTVDLNAQRVYMHGRDVILTPKEYQILVLLIKNAGEPVEGAAIYERLWALPAADGLHTVRVHISAIRRKLGLGGDCPVAIQSVRGEGYCFTYTPTGL